MKKVLFVLALVAVYGVSMATTSSIQVKSLDQTVSIVADVDNAVSTPAIEKEEGKKAEKSKGEAKACSGNKAKAKCCSGSKAKADGCSGKTAAKGDCASSCAGKKK